MTTLVVNIGIITEISVKEKSVRLTYVILTNIYSIIRHRKKICVTDMSFERESVEAMTRGENFLRSPVISMKFNKIVKI